MWTCEKCGEQLEDSFDQCWKCTDAATPESKLPALPNPMTCPRCTTPIEYVGTKRFHEGSNWGILGEIGEIFVNRESFDFYVCPRCGRVEMFVDGIGEEYRSVKG